MPARASKKATSPSVQTTEDDYCDYAARITANHDGPCSPKEMEAMQTIMGSISLQIKANVPEFSVKAAKALPSKRMCILFISSETVCMTRVWNTLVQFLHNAERDLGGCPENDTRRTAFFDVCPISERAKAEAETA
jgi:hypothetical protein